MPTLPTTYWFIVWTVKKRLSGVGGLLSQLIEGIVFSQESRHCGEPQDSFFSDLPLLATFDSVHHWCQRIFFRRSNSTSTSTSSVPSNSNKLCSSQNSDASSIDISVGTLAFNQGDVQQTFPERRRPRGNQKSILAKKKGGGGLATTSLGVHE